jgi:hypothetical protein
MLPYRHNIHYYTYSGVVGIIPKYHFLEIINYFKLHLGQFSKTAQRMHDKYNLKNTKLNVMATTLQY